MESQTVKVENEDYQEQEIDMDLIDDYETPGSPENDPLDLKVRPDNTKKEETDLLLPDENKSDDDGDEVNCPEICEVLIKEEKISSEKDDERGADFLGNDERFNSKTSMHSKERPSENEEPSKSFSLFSFVQSNMKCTGRKPRYCSVCNKLFTKSSNFRRHFLTHSNEKPFQCKECSKSFASSYCLKHHMWTHTGIKPYKCKECSKTFTNTTNLISHMRTHTGETPFECKECGKSFTSSCSLKYHAWKHTGVKPFKCKDCTKSFTSSSDLHKHIRTHTGEKPFLCNVCCQAFSRSSHLKRHMHTHTGEKPYQCEQCGLSFTQLTHLKRHFRIHTDEKDVLNKNNELSNEND